MGSECKWACTKRSKLGCPLSRACIEAWGGLTKTKPELTKLLEYTNIVVNINMFTYVRKVGIVNNYNWFYVLCFLAISGLFSCRFRPY